MYKKTSGLLSLGIMLGVLMMLPTSVNAHYDAQQKYDVHGPPHVVTANELQLFFDGIFEIDGVGSIPTPIDNAVAYSTAFTRISIVHIYDPPTTIVTFSGGEVAPGEETWACFDTKTGEKKKPKSSTWARKEAGEVTIAWDAGAPIGGGGNDKKSASLFTVEVSNSWNSDSLGTDFITGTNVYWTDVPVRYPLADLNENLYNEPSITWHPLWDFWLPYGSSGFYHLVTPSPGSWVIFRFIAEGTLGLPPVVQIWQMPSGEPAESILVSPSSIDFGTVVSGDSPGSFLSLQCGGGEMIGYTIVFDYGSFGLAPTDPWNWLSASPSSGTIICGNTDAVAVAATTAGLTNGTYTADLLIESSAYVSTVVPVSMMVTGGTARAVFEPEPAYVFYLCALPPMNATVYVGNFNDSHTAADVTEASVNGIQASILGVADHPNFVDEAVALSIPIMPFLEGFEGLWDTTVQTFSVTGTFADATGFTTQGWVRIVGHSSKPPFAWIVPPDEVVLPGDVDYSGQVDIADLTGLVAYLFTGGQGPEPLQIADCDCSLSVDVADISYLVSYLFTGGPSPCFE